MPAWIPYTVLRIAAFALPFGLLLLLDVGWLLAAAVAMVIGFCISFLFLTRLRARMASDLAASRVSKKPSTAPERGPDELLEDEVVDGETPRAEPRP